MINLLPPEVKSEHRYGRYNKVIFIYSISAIIIGIFSMAIMMFNLQLIHADEIKVNKEIDTNKKAAEQLDKGQKSIETVAGQLSTIQTLYEGEVKFSELIPKIASILPDGVVLNNLTLTGGSFEPLQLEVDMKSQDLAAVLQQNLINSELFEAADVVSITSKGPEDTSDYPFHASIKVTFKGAAEKKKKEEAKKKADAAQAEANQKPESSQ